MRCLHAVFLLAALGCGCAGKPKFEGLERRKGAFINKHALPPVCMRNSTAQRDDPNLLNAHALYKRYLGIIGEDTLRALTIDSLGAVDIVPGQSAAKSLRRRLVSKGKKTSARRLPEKVNTCAIVGSSGHLQLTAYGPNIDQFDIVARGNQAPTKEYEKYVGSKTSMRFFNEALSRRYRIGLTGALKVSSIVCTKIAYEQEKRLYGDAALSNNRRVQRGFIRMRARASGSRRLLTEGDSGNRELQFGGRALLQTGGRLSPLQALGRGPMCREGMQELRETGRLTDSEVKFREWKFPLEKNVMATMINEFKLKATENVQLNNDLRSMRPDVKTAVVNNVVSFLAEDMISNWADRLVCQNVLKTKGGTRPTTGLIMALTLLPLCNKLVLYGFGPAAGNQDNVGYHFYKGLLNRNWRTTSKDVHNFEAEYLFLKSLAERGLLTICNNANSPECGLGDENLDYRPG